jgi:hypothetical protein
MPPPTMRYTSAGPDDAVSTEGITFWLDDVEFTCHGRISAFDLSEFAGPAADAGENTIDPDVVRLLSDLMRMVLGDATYRLVSKHRRLHQTPDVVMQQILMDVVAAVGKGRSARPSPSPAGPRPVPQPAAASPSPAGVPAWTGEEWHPPQPRVDAGSLAALAAQGDIRFAPAPDPAAAATNPAAGKRPARVRRLSLAHQEQGVQEEQAG